ncbi:MAG: tRNA (adenosine(37)-N6)-threonylcarbamoyltransferase complex ATPase subunit type 1 TsaE [Elusimicrobia bacterium]|nr:tRNA (adenosine(37)-N6)-threonylcarbamoyltransferase complex ATPase subunit type 1 TsaE [Elusimicrobiota bacterium]
MPHETALESAEKTRALGRRLGSLLRGGDCVLLVGDLGAGKTTLTQGIALGAGYKGRVSSPTFVLVRVYAARRLTLYHIDFYRVAVDQTRDIGLEDYVSDPGAACVVEWPEAGRGYLPEERLEVRLSYGKAENERKVSFKAFGARARELRQRLLFHIIRSS